ncbi:MAG: AlwI family type II restriction endonuclease [Propionibacteriaceae bacterium]|jgi:hypothetical protein|nr:AlwI family type II restriction endonuclease [Propionibacteriaceae bacterium]
MAELSFPVRVRPWHLANTTVRNPGRLQAGLRALIDRGYAGNMNRDMEEKIARALHEESIISLSDSTKDVTSIARKWRSALVQLGFLWPDVDMRPRIRDVRQSELGAAFTLTPNGERLLEAQSFLGVQEVLLRSIAALTLPSPLEPAYDFSPFSPLRHVIRIIRELERSGNGRFLTRLEIASIVIFSVGSDRLDSVVKKIIRQRDERAIVIGKRRFESETIETKAGSTGNKRQTLYDYQDVVCRYLKATGLFQSCGRGIELAPELEAAAKSLADEPDEQLPRVEYLVRLANGSALPTDTLAGAVGVLDGLLDIASDSGVSFDSAGYDLSTTEGLSLARHDLLDLVFQQKELEYSKNQRNKMEEILAYLRMLDEGKDKIKLAGEQLTIPKAERAAYFEWLLWRVLLALNQLEVPPDKVRRFNADNDFLPIGTAPGGGADVIGVYRDSVIVVEVTLTSGSRQVAAEGEPVRRHVADVLEKYEPLGKAVYGLFIARQIDTNTAETFRTSVWYKHNDERVVLSIVPLTLRQLIVVLERGVKKGNLEPSLLIDTIVELAELRADTDGAPDWKEKIEKRLS